MKKSDFIRKLDHAVIETAIADAERLSSGEIRVVILHHKVPEPVAEAQKTFLRLGMDKTKHRNAVLILVAPASQNFAVIGDERVHQKCGDSFWEELTKAMSSEFQKNNFTAGLRHGTARAGQLLAEHFPRRPDDVNELPDTVIEK